VYPSVPHNESEQSNKQSTHALLAKRVGGWKNKIP
jgi:hypothetical protein